MIGLEKLTGVLFLLSSCNAIQGNIARMDDDTRISLALNRVLESKSPSNHGGNQPDCYPKETISSAPPEWVQRKSDEQARNRQRADAMLDAHAVGDIVTSQGELVGCSVM